VLQLGGGECAGVSQVKIGTIFFEAAHERNYRDALKFQRKFEDSTKCAEEMARLIGQGLAELLGGQKHEDLKMQAEELRRVFPTKPRLAKALAQFAEDFARPVDALNDDDLTKWFSDLDAWTMEVAEFCLSFDRQLDLTGALPFPLPASAKAPASQAAQPSVMV
jgi:sulfite reductase (NADPH) hemoprotein beta-component